MTGERLHTTYPQYCFHLSPTLEKWCRFRAQDIHSLTSHKGFEGQNLYFHLNHPIRWVQVAGVVVAIDEWPGRRIYTVDDSSGATIECILSVPRNEATQATKPEGSAEGATPHGSKTTATQEEVKPVIDGEVGVGDVLLVKGNITIFRDTKQIRVYRISHLRCTEEEVQFWTKMTEFNANVLSTPWALSEKEVKRCHREATRSRGGDAGRVHRAKRKPVETTVVEHTSKPKTEKAMPTSDGGGSLKTRVTGLERKPKRVKALRVEGKYSALGI